MSLGYWWRLAALSAAVWWLAGTVLSAAVAAVAPAAALSAERMRAASAARLLFLLRMAPALGAAILVLLFAAPNYLRLETDRGPETMGGVCLAAAFFAAAGWGASLVRGSAAAAASRRFLRGCRPVRTCLAPDVWVVDGPRGLVAVAGILRPRVLVSRSLAGDLTADQMAAILRHERAHGAALDNLKRLCLRMAPATLLFRRQFTKLERAWARQAEWAADDSAAAGNEERSIALAEALVRVAREGGAPRELALATPLVEETAQIAERVDRLLGGGPRRTPSCGIGKAAAGAAAVASMALIHFHAASMGAIHELMEYLVR